MTVTTWSFQAANPLNMPGSIVNCDWGTTRLRLRAVGLEGFVVRAECRSLDGVAALAERYAAADRPARYRHILAEGLVQLADQPGAKLDGAPILVSGMAGSSIGWQEVPYARLSVALDGSDLAWRELEPIRSERGSHRLVLFGGVCSDIDVMRGEETELIGLFTLPIAEPLATGALVIKPGTHSKHMRVENGRLVALQTFMTGELFEVLSTHSVLRHSLGERPTDEPIRAESFDDLLCGVRDAQQCPLPAALFRVRTRQLLDELGGPANRAYLSGVLLGSELAYLTQGQHESLPLVLCATTPLMPAYRAALDALGLTERLTVVPPDEAELLSARGQAALWLRLNEA